MTARSIQAFLLSLVASFFLTLLVRKIAKKTGFIARPAADRWSKREVALGGGIAMAAVILAGGLFLDREIVVGLLPALAAVFLLGLVDDLKGVSPSGKLLGQTVAATYAVAHGYVFPLPWPVLAIPLTVVLMVGICNAVNLVDNMDGLAAGVVVIVALALGNLTLSGPGDSLSVLAFIVAGAAAGFLIHNFAPAKVFMGDAGSLTLGLILACLATRVHFHEDVPQGLNFVPAFMLLVVPLFDTLLVTISRTSALRPITMGGRDHTSHRLVSLGLNDRRAVLVLYAFAAFGCWSASTVLRAHYPVAIPVTLLFAVVAVVLLLFMLDVRVYTTTPPRRKPNKHGAYPLPETVVTMIEIGMDVGVIALAWMGAHYVRFAESGLQSYKIVSVIPLLPYLIAVKLICLYSFNLYRGLWRTLILSDIYRMFKAVVLGSLAVTAMLALMSRLQDVSRVVLLLDCWLTLLGVIGTRAAFTALGRWSRRLSLEPKRVAYVGSVELAPSVEDALGREPGCVFVGVITPGAAGDSVPSAPVLGSLEEVRSIVERDQIDVLLVAKSSQKALASLVQATAVLVRPFSVQLG